MSNVCVHSVVDSLEVHILTWNPRFASPEMDAMATELCHLFDFSYDNMITCFNQMVSLSNGIVCCESKTSEFKYEFVHILTVGNLAVDVTT
jgi:hypothetical protein